MSEPPSPRHGTPNALVAAQMLRNRLFTVALVGAALLNAMVVAVVAAAVSRSIVAEIVVLSLIAAFVAGTWLYASGDVLARTGARAPDTPRELTVAAMVATIAGRLGIDEPRVFIVDDPAHNAFSSGHGHGAVVVFSTGLIGLLDDAELEGVAAHEVAHIANRDTGLTVLSIALLSWTQTVSSLINVMAFFAWHGGRGLLEHNGRDWIETLVVRALGFAAMLGAATAFVVGQIWFLAALVVRLGLGRQREWMADATAARLTGNPAAMSEALRKVHEAPTELTAGGRLVRELCIAGVPSKGWLSDLLATHPHPSRRIAQLQAFAAGQEPPERGVTGPAIAAACVITALALAVSVAVIWRPTPPSYPYEAAASTPVVAGVDSTSPSDSVDGSPDLAGTPTLTPADSPTPSPGDATVPALDTPTPDASTASDQPSPTPGDPSPSPTPSPQPTTTTYTVTVWGNQSWTTTGITVTAGASVSITASGVVFIAGSDPGKTPAGAPGCVAPGDNSIPPGPFLVPGLTCWALVGQIGAGAAFEVGAGTSLTAATSGPLVLGVNDNFFGDNSGSWTATIAVTQ
jgi:heat shock protein HtpX